MTDLLTLPTNVGLDLGAHDEPLIVPHSMSLVEITRQTEVATVGASLHASILVGLSGSATRHVGERERKRARKNLKVN
jgi:hypothetical protein